MRKNKKMNFKFLSLGLAGVILLAVSILPPFLDVSAADYSYENVEGGICITEAIVDGPIVEVPSQIGGAAVVEIRSGAFKNRYDITELTIPNSVTKISAGAFSGMKNLEKLTIPFVGESSEATGEAKLLGYVFGTEAGTGLHTMQIYDSEQTTVFYMPYHLKEITVTGGTLGKGSFSNCTTIETVSLPSSITTIPENCFKGTQKLWKVDVTAVENVEKNAFRNSSVSTMDLSTIKYIGKNAFTNTKFTTLELSSIEEIHEQAFSGLHDLTSVMLGDSLHTIGDKAFSYAYRLESVELPSSLANMGEGVFYQNIRLKTIASKSDKFVVQDGVLYNADQTELITYPAAKSDSSFVVPESVTVIYANAFNGNQNLTTVSVSDGVQRVGRGAFSAMPALSSLKLSSACESNYVFGTVPFEGAKAVKQMVAGEEMYFYLPKRMNPYEEKDISVYLMNELSGKKISVLGDSISTYPGYSNDAVNTNSTIGDNIVYYNEYSMPSVNDTWWMRTALQTEMNVLVNNSYAGDKVTELGSKRCVELHDDTGADAGTVPDIIAVYLGINDFIGNVTTEDFETSYDFMIAKMVTKYPNADMFLFNYVPNGANNRETIDMEAFNQIVKTTAEKYDCTLVDLYNRSGITLDNASTYMGDADKLHPNANGMEAISDTFLNTLYHKYVLEGQ